MQNFDTFFKCKLLSNLAYYSGSEGHWMNIKGKIIFDHTNIFNFISFAISFSISVLVISVNRTHSPS